MNEENATRCLSALRRSPVTVVLTLSLLAGCAEEPIPRPFAVFMEDRIAREGTLVRCNQNHEATLNDIECANARRAAATIALRYERERRETLERESERKLAALRAQIDVRQRAELEAAARAEAAEDEAYEALWEDGQPVDPDGTTNTAPAQVVGQPAERVIRTPDPDVPAEPEERQGTMPRPFRGE